MDASTLDNALLLLIREQKVTNQSSLQKKLRAKGIRMTQPSISRALNKLNVTKVDGVYQLPAIAPGDSAAVDFLDVRPCGDNLLVLKTTPGNASRVAYLIDNHAIEGIAGSIAGDDTIFIGVQSKRLQSTVIKKILSLLQRT